MVVGRQRQSSLSLGVTMSNGLSFFCVLSFSHSLSPAPSISPAEINPRLTVRSASVSLRDVLALRLEELSSHGLVLGSDSENWKCLLINLEKNWPSVHQDIFTFQLPEVSITLLFISLSSNAHSYTWALQHLTMILYLMEINLQKQALFFFFFLPGKEWHLVLLHKTS